MIRMFLFFTLMLSVKAAISDTITVNQWWVSSPVIVSRPFFHTTKNVDNEMFKDENLVSYSHHEISSLTPGDLEVPLNWQPLESTEKVYFKSNVPIDNPRISYAVFYLELSRWMKIKVEVASPQMIRVWCNEEETGIKRVVDMDPSKPGKISKELKLEPGKHRFVVKHLTLPGDSTEPNLTAKLISSDLLLSENGKISLTPDRTKRLSDILDGTKARRVSVSYDGSYYAITYSNTPAGGKNSTTWTEIYRSVDKTLVYRIDHRTASNMQWLPQSNRLSYVVKSGDKNFVEVFNLINFTTEGIFSEGKGFSGYKWLPNEGGIVYSVTEEFGGKYETTRRIDGMADRQPGFKDRGFLHYYDLKTKTRSQLTYGNQTTQLMDISPDSRWIAVSVSVPDYQERPFSKQTLYLLNIQTQQIDTLWVGKRWGASVSFSPDGKKLLCSGGPSSFGKIGENIGKMRYANNYDKQLYIFDIASRKVDAITYAFNPSVEDAIWSSVDNNIYLMAVNRDSRTLFRYLVDKKSFEPLTNLEDYISGFSMAGKALVCSYQVSKINRYGIYYLRDFVSGKIEEIEGLEKKNYQHVVFGETKDWNFKTKSGKEISGRVYYPVNFDPAKKYPVIVYYYGGTTPVGRIFGGRYPFNLWAGAGYLVYVLQPSGAIGFGQEFSAAHVNNWGRTVADEIIEGTQKFLAAHPYANPKKVGCIGASYGGFMTMYLLTRTNIFAAAVSHAGISSISSYWGEGYWGYGYSAEASADSYPWNAPDLYVNQSPLFRADKVKTPLLLLTGDKDTNVPPGESIQMYTALKILGRPVELITVKDEDHHINGYQNRISWHNTIMAWWAKQLKDEPEWWSELYPAKNF